ncbi:unnamed protein product [Clonostachys rosea]|uniref:Uncharacterized protein n=1 Tax=Bionectria ochroleuca TaxID=29856 RepID=A0ABY6TNG7_BIOOC|nr:unnamed protein product [Clonostachys rosea]
MQLEDKVPVEPSLFNPTTVPVGSEKAWQIEASISLMKVLQEFRDTDAEDYQHALEFLRGFGKLMKIDNPELRARWMEQAERLGVEDLDRV